MIPASSLRGVTGFALGRVKRDLRAEERKSFRLLSQAQHDRLVSSKRNNPFALSLN